jgi:hypothetical protein
MQGLLDRKKQLHTALADACAFVAPTLNVHLDAEVVGKRRRAVGANDWLTLGVKAFLARVRNRWDEPSRASTPSDYWRKVGQTLRIIYARDGRPIGRATAWARRGGVAEIGGFRSDTSWPPAFGIFTARATRASRDHAEIIADSESLREWARGQAEMDDVRSFGPLTRLNAAWICGHLDVIGDLPICFAKSGGLTVNAFRQWVSKRKAVRVVVTEGGASPDFITMDDDEVFTLTICDTDTRLETYFETGGPLLRLLTDTMCDAWGIEKADAVHHGKTSQWLNEDDGYVSFDGMTLTFRRPTTKQLRR